MGVQGNRLLFFVETLQMLLWLFDFFFFLKKKTLQLFDPPGLPGVFEEATERERTRNDYIHFVSS
jgi:hypothetical protein